MQQVMTMRSRRIMPPLHPLYACPTCQLFLCCVKNIYYIHNFSNYGHPPAIKKPWSEPSNQGRLMNALLLQRLYAINRISGFILRIDNGIAVSLYLFCEPILLGKVSTIL